MVERLVYTEKVVGSIPTSPIIFTKNLFFVMLVSKAGLAQW